MNLLLSERIAWNVADRYILQCVGFPIDRIEELDEVFMQMEDSLYIHVLSLAEPILLEWKEYSDLLCPRAKLVELQQEIETYFAEVSPQANQALWTILVQYLWRYCDRTLTELKHERLVKDPELGFFFRALEDAKKRGLFRSRPHDESL